MEEEIDQEPHEPKLGFVEILLIFPFLILFDIIGIVIIFFGLDDFFILDIINLLVVGYFMLRGINAAGYYICSVVEVIPYVGDVFPGYTIGFAITIYFDRNPKQAKAIDETIGKVAKLKQGGIKGAGESRIESRASGPLKERRQLSADPEVAKKQALGAEKHAGRSYSVATRGGGSKEGDSSDEDDNTVDLSGKNKEEDYKGAT